MKRMRLLTVVRCFCLVAALAAGFAWWRSGSHDDWMGYSTAGGIDYAAHSAGGRLLVSRDDNHYRVGFPASVPGFKKGSYSYAPFFITRASPLEISLGPSWQWRGFSWRHDEEVGLALSRLFYMPGRVPGLAPPPAPAILGWWHWMEVGVPWWFIETVFCVPLIFAAWRVLRARAARKPGCCQKCGYDLRASPVRCPECGLSCSKT